MSGYNPKDYLLTPYRVLDLTGETGFMCGKVLGDLGAEVVLIEPPGGHAARAIGPFYKRYGARHGVNDLGACFASSDALQQRRFGWSWANNIDVNFRLCFHK